MLSVLAPPYEPVFWHCPVPRIRAFIGDSRARAPADLVSFAADPARAGVYRSAYFFAVDKAAQRALNEVAADAAFAIGFRPTWPAVARVRALRIRTGGLPGPDPDAIGRFVVAFAGSGLAVDGEDAPETGAVIVPLSASICLGDTALLLVDIVAPNEPPELLPLYAPCSAHEPVFHRTMRAAPHDRVQRVLVGTRGRTVTQHARRRRPADTARSLARIARDRKVAVCTSRFDAAVFVGATGLALTTLNRVPPGYEVFAYDRAGLDSNIVILVEGWQD